MFNGSGIPAGNAYPSGHLIPSHFFWGGGDLLMLQKLRPVFKNLPCLFSTFHIDYPSVLSRFLFISWIITYLVSSRPYIEICLVCKIYGRWGGAEPSIYFTNPTYFYVRSGTDQISVLFRRGPVYAILRKIRKFICTADKLTTSMLARKCDVASCATSQNDVFDAGMKVKATFEVLWVRKSRQKQHYLVARCGTCKT